MSLTQNLTVLGNKVEGSLEAEDLEVFDAPNVSEVKFVTDEVTALCPVTMQPDIYTVEITYEPDQYCVESKTLKLYLTKFRNQGIFGESITALIADDLFAAIKPKKMSIRTTQQIRGGLKMSSEAVRFG